VAVLRSGRGSLTATPGAVISAVVDVLSVFHIRDVTMPVTPFVLDVHKWMVVACLRLVINDKDDKGVGTFETTTAE
jgi:hypothetical protein